MTDPSATPSPVPARTVTVSFDLARLPSVATALGVSLLSAAVVVSAMYSRYTDDLDTSNFAMGLLAAAGLLGVAIVAHLLVPDAEHRASLVSWPGAFGVVGLGIMLGVLITDDDLSVYTGAGVALVLSVGGFLITRATPFVIGTVGALVVLYAQVFDNVIDDDGDGNNLFIILGAAVMIFVLVVTAAGWLLPATRELTGIVVGFGGLISMAGILVALGATRTITVAFSSADLPADFPDDPDFDSFPGGPHIFAGGQDDPYKNDVYVVLLYCVILALFWFGCALGTGHVGFRLLVLGSATVLIPVATIATMASHPTWWEVAACGIGGLVLVGVAARSRGSNVAAASAAPPQ